MADTKISDLTAASTLAGTETLPIVQSATTKKVAVDTLLSDRNVVKTTANNAFSVAQRGTATVLTSSAASIAINLNNANNFTHTTTENTTLAAPSNPTAGQSGCIVITQGATPRTLAYNSFWKFPGGTVPSLTASASAVDVLVYYVESASRATCRLLADVK